MTSENKVFVGILAVVALGVGLLLFSGSSNRGTSSGNQSDVVGLQVGNQAPAFVVTTIDGQQVTSDMLRGQVIVMTSSAAWCSTCVIEAQQFAPVYAQVKDNPVTFLTIDIDPSVTPEQIQQFRRDNNTPWDYSQEVGAKQLIQDYQLNRFEITYVLDQEGIIRFKDGEITKTAKLEQVVQSLL